MASDSALNLDVILRMKVDELKATLKQLGAATTGKKIDLQNRLQDIIAANTEALVANEAPKESSGVLECDGNCAEEVKSPTIQEADKEIDVKSSVATTTSIPPADLLLPTPAHHSAVSFDSDDITVDYDDILLVDERITDEDNLVPQDITVDQENLKSINRLNTDVKIDTALQISTELLISNDDLSQRLEAERQLKDRLLALKKNKLSLSSVKAVQGNSAGSGNASSHRDNHDFQSQKNATSHVRIDNFQRPLTLKALHQWLQDTCNVKLDVSSIWVNHIKTHCYVDFPTVEDASRCIATVSGLKFPSTSTSTLVANFASISAAEAPESSEAHLRLNERANVGGDTLIRNPPRAVFPISQPDTFATTSVKDSGKQLLIQSSGKRGRGFDDQETLGRKKSRVVVQYNSTKALPSLEWLPVDEETVAARKAYAKEMQQKPQGNC